MPRAPHEVDVAVPEPGLTPGELIARAASFRQVLRDAQIETEARGTHSPEMHEAFVEAGFYRTLQPRRFGGYEFDLPTFAKVIVEIARGCPSTGWCLCLASGHALQVGSFFSEEAQREIFGPEGEFRAPFRVQPGGTATPVDGGYVIEGRWDYCSGAPYSTHFMCGALVPGTRPPTILMVVVPPGGWTMLDDWGGDATLGLRGSGSNTVVVEGVRVPERHTAALSVEDTDVSAGTIGSRLHGNPLYAGRFMSFFHAELVSVLVGTARAALDEAEEILRSRKTVMPPQVLRYEHPDFQRDFGLAMGMVDAAEAILLHSTEAYMAYCARGPSGGEPFSIEEDVRLYATLQQAGRLSWEATELLFRTAGSTAAKRDQKMQRYLRDMAMYRGHIAAQFTNTATAVARAHFGMPFRMIP